MIGCTTPVVPHWIPLIGRHIPLIVVYPNSTMTLSSTKTVDPRVVRTRSLLENALFTLLGEHPYTQITVKDIAANAGVNRATFYAHFVDKDDLFRTLLRNAMDDILSEKLGSQEKEASFEAYLDALLQAAFEYADWVSGKCRAAKHERDAPLPEEEFLNRIEVHLSSWLKEGSDHNTSSCLFARGISSMIVSVASGWGRMAVRPAAAKMIRNLHMMVLGAVAAFPRQITK